MSYDIIGDIHGHANQLRALLAKLGYREVDGVYRHSSRRAIFLGDFIDRGRQNREVVSIARRMTASGTALAVMGNHEFNALAFATPDPELPGEFLRHHSKKNNDQHRAFLSEFAAHPDEYRACLKWFETLPLFLELPGLRVIHACWHEAALNTIAEFTTADDTLTPALLTQSSRKGSKTYEAVETLLKGPEVSLPPGRSFPDKDKNLRTQVRIKWWLDHSQHDFHELVVGPPQAVNAARDAKKPKWPMAPYAQTEIPVFVGHYWLTGRPAPLTSNVACLDYSVARGGKLVAYRWNGERQLSEDNMVQA